MNKPSTIEKLISIVIEDISRNGFSSIMPFSIGNVEDRMLQFADANGIELASHELYMSEGNQAARSNCSSSRRCHRSSHRGSTWLLLSRCKDKHFFWYLQVFLDLFAIFLPQKPFSLQKYTSRSLHVLPRGGNKCSIEHLRRWKTTCFVPLWIIQVTYFSNQAFRYGFSLSPTSHFADGEKACCYEQGVSFWPIHKLFHIFWNSAQTFKYYLYLCFVIQKSPSESKIWPTTQ